METPISLSARSLQFYVINKRWASEIEFFKIETAFLHRLLDDYFIRLADVNNIDKLRVIEKSLLKLEEDKEHTELLLNNQLKQLELMAEDIIPENIEELAVIQVQLEYMMINLISDYREAKKELFTAVEAIMREEKYLEG